MLACSFIKTACGGLNCEKSALTNGNGCVSGAFDEGPLIVDNTVRQGFQADLPLHCIAKPPHSNSTQRPFARTRNKQTISACNL